MLGLVILGGVIAATPVLAVLATNLLVWLGFVEPPGDRAPALTADDLRRFNAVLADDRRLAEAIDRIRRQP